MKHTITKTEQGYVCQAVNPYAHKYQDTFPNYSRFAKENPECHFIHPNPLPDNSIVDGEDLTEPFLQIFDNGQWFTELEHPLYDKDSETRMAISFKHPELMVEHWEFRISDGSIVVITKDIASRITHDGIKCTFIRKEQIKSPRFEARRKGNTGTDYITLLRETSMRANLAFPLDDQELEWFEEGINVEFCARLVNELDKVRP